jgi:hypothetical protein
MRRPRPTGRGRPRGDGIETSEATEGAAGGGGGNGSRPTPITQIKAMRECRAFGLSLGSGSRQFAHLHDPVGGRGYVFISRPRYERNPLETAGFLRRATGAPSGVEGAIRGHCCRGTERLAVRSGRLIPGCGPGGRGFESPRSPYGWLLARSLRLLSGLGRPTHAVGCDCPSAPIPPRVVLGRRNGRC